ncbi:MAG: transketolase [Ignavibacteria bacterium]|nr:transketolase [Ignavibacteria bacterium]
MTLDQQKDIAFRVREHCIRMATRGGCFIGASLSCADVLVYLYTNYLTITPDNLSDPNRDYLFLSKGHDVPALYGTLAELGFIDRERLSNHLLTTDDIYWHPNRNIPGVEFYSGSLGHLLSVAIGVAFDCKLRGTANKIVVILGDGELNEGSIWEGLLVAQAHKLDNLIIVVDRNEFQANMRTEELIPLEPLSEKFRVFGCIVREVDGHNFEDLHDSFSGITIGNGRPNVVIAHTIRGKGTPSIEARADRWFANFTADEITQLLAELHGGRTAELTSETLIVR